MNKEMLGPSAIGRRWGVNRGVVITLIEEKRLPALVVRKTAKRTTYRVSLKDLEEYEKSQSTVQPEAACSIDEEAHPPEMLAAASSC